MFLSYRGLSYQARSFPANQPQQTIKFRGVAYQIGSATPEISSTPKQLKYRGIAYVIG
jgi:hypothetical protein